MNIENSDYKAHISDELYDEVLKEASKATRQADRIMVKSLVALVKSGHATFLFLQDDEIRNVWSKMIKNAKVNLTKRKTAEELYQVKMNAYNRLTPEERKILKITRPTKPRV